MSDDDVSKSSRGNGSGEKRSDYWFLFQEQSKGFAGISDLESEKKISSPE